jgi:hypothetical protein
MSLRVPVRTAAAGVVAALLVAGCGGGSSNSGSGKSYSVSVAVSGLSGTLTVVQSSDMLSFTADGTQTFSTLVPAGNIYAVTVGTQPATQYCTVSNAAGLISANVTVDVTCNASTGGIWEGVGQNGESYVAMGDESGDFWLLDITNDAGGDIYVSGGSLAVSGANVSGSDTGQALIGTYSDGQVYGSGTWSGTLAARSALNLISTFTTAAGTVLPQAQLGLTYDPLYAQGSSLAAIAGTYVEGTTTFTISSAGILTAADSSTHCTLSGAVDPEVSNYNLYSIQYTYSNCTGGTNNPRNGLSFDGYGALAPANSTLNPSTVPHFISVEAANLTTGYVYESLNLASN